MSPFYLLAFVAGYLVVLLGIARVTSGSGDQSTYFLGNRASPWLAVAFGMIGDSLSGVTFISVPGWVGATQFTYLQMVLGYLAGYAVIAYVLLPLYYERNLTSIYSYLGQRLGVHSERTGAFFFILSRLIGAAFRLYLAVSVMQTYVFSAWGVPFGVTITLIIGAMLLYTYRGGIKTLVWTDALQSLLLILGVILSVWAIRGELGTDLPGLARQISQSQYSTVFNWNWASKGYFWKQFLSGMFIAIAMTGLDQNMMQKNLSCRSLKDAQKNVALFCVILVAVNICFLALGASLFLYAEQKGIPVPGRSDELFPLLALHHLGPGAALIFMIGLTAATFSSADSVLTTLTTSFCIDLLKMDRPDSRFAQNSTRLRHLAHIGFAVVLGLVIFTFRWMDNPTVVQAIFTLAGYTYGPLLGMFAFGLLNQREVRDRWVPLVCLISPCLCLLLDKISARLFGGYQIGFELLLVNAAFTYLGIWTMSRRKQTELELPNNPRHPHRPDVH